MVLEVKWEAPVKPGSCKCELCEEDGYMEGEIGSEAYPHGTHFVYCKGHYTFKFELVQEHIDSYVDQDDYDE